jgi:hypothetical protein
MSVASAPQKFTKITCDEIFSRARSRTACSTALLLSPAMSKPNTNTAIVKSQLELGELISMDWVFGVAVAQGQSCPFEIILPQLILRRYGF